MVVYLTVFQWVWTNAIARWSDAKKIPSLIWSIISDVKELHETIGIIEPTSR